VIGGGFWLLTGDPSRRQALQSQLAPLVGNLVNNWLGSVFAVKAARPCDVDSGTE
jgi:hypothetical protein